ncbi:hypothetical protein GGI43DRAFT_402384 [Trichoderma evansii]
MSFTLIHFLFTVICPSIDTLVTSSLIDEFLYYTLAKTDLLISAAQYGKGKRTCLGQSIKSKTRDKCCSAIGWIHNFLPATREFDP